MLAFYHGTAILPGTWIMRRVRLDVRNNDVHGWNWGPGDPVFVLGPATVDDTMSVRAPCPVIAVALAGEDGWPPRKSKRYNWEYAVV